MKTKIELRILLGGKKTIILRFEVYLISISNAAFASQYIDYQIIALKFILEKGST